jgi:hypothetical protein
MTMRTRILLAMATAGACTTTSTPRDEELANEPVAVPSVRAPFEVAPRAARAERIVHGRVSAITYDVPATGTLAGIPRTHVMIAVDAALVGGADALDLAFLGGAHPDGRVTLASDIPLFGVGDEVVLLVDRDRASGCPLVDCADGLIRLSGGKAYDAGGHPLIARGSRLELGPREAIPEATTFRVGRQTFTVEMSEREPAQDAPIDRASLLAHFKNLPTTITE